MTEKKVITTKSLREEWAERLGIPVDDANFEYHLRDKLANESQDVLDSTLILTGVVKPKTPRVALKKDEIPAWLKAEQDREESKISL